MSEYVATIDQCTTAIVLGRHATVRALPQFGARQTGPPRGPVVDPRHAMQASHCIAGDVMQPRRLAPTADSRFRYASA
jgi:hypothetical protein